MSWWRNLPTTWRLRLIAHALAVGAFVLAIVAAAAWGRDGALVIAVLMVVACGALVWAVVLQLRHGFQRPYGDG
ncbi:hypothetical protein [Luteipulveratus flavus]|uniref:Sensor histidine kinase n=1 Tax=Luteipulveratus flavus TaxID=3031728 RepID=A0ABT6CB06_9MICO|nr:hypothetical protein [Luteipulveratus sp. YIM 133296]MDF8266075.1 hypothetical protein [Luteipulveratus sp. YIM 133296]